MTSTFNKDSATKQLGGPEPIRVQRDGDLDLQFSGWKLGEGSHGVGGGGDSDWNRGVNVRVWLADTGELVTGAHRWTRWQGESDRYTAAVHSSPESALSWLRQDSMDGELGPASKEAWEAACAEWRGLEGQDVELLGDA